MSEIALEKIGFIAKTYGVDGSFKLVVHEPFDEIIDQAKYLFLDMDGLPVPFFIEQWHFNKQINCKLEGINNREDAQFYISKEISIERKYIPDELGKTNKNHLIGFEIFNEKKLLGAIVDINMLPQQIMAIVKIADKELMIPLHDQLIDSVDEERKVIYMNLPEGLVDL